MARRKSLKQQELIARAATISYATRVSDADFWRAVGAELARRRRIAGITSTFTFYKQHHGAPAINTLDAIEEGRPGKVENLERYCALLGVSMVDIFRAVLDAIDGLGPSITDAEWAVILAYREIPEGDRPAWLEVGMALARRNESPGTA